MAQIPTTARKIAKGAKTFVEVLDQDGEVITSLGGKRAERATVVLVTTLLAGHGQALDGGRDHVGATEVDGTPHVEGLRAKSVGPRTVNRNHYGCRQHYSQHELEILDLTGAVR
jgi:hypothetical protein